MLADAFVRDGFVLVPGVLAADGCASVLADLQGHTGQGPGARHLLTLPWCERLAGQLRAAPGLADLIPPGHLAVQCSYFEKSRDSNWLVALHQDLSIPVQRKMEHPALKGWALKEATYFVQAPPQVLEQLVAVRVHLEDCGPDDGPLRVVPGSHAMGVFDSADAVQLRDERGEVTCPAAQGEALVMRPLLLHASSKASGSSRRRVLHFLFGPAQLPYGLAWAAAV